MKFSTRADIEAPVEAVFAVLSDFAVFERSAMRRGAEVQRIEPVGPAAAAAEGMRWAIAFDWRGRPRRIALELAEFAAPALIGLAAEGAGYGAGFRLSLVELARRRTRLGVEIEVRPRTLATRLAMQSARLGRAALDRRFEARVAEAAAEIERRCRMAG